MARIEQDIREEEMRQRQDAKLKREQLDRAERNRNAPVDDSQMVDEMFGFIDAATDSSGEGAAPTAFKVSAEFPPFSVNIVMLLSKGVVGVGHVVNIP